MYIWRRGDFPTAFCLARPFKMRFSRSLWGSQTSAHLFGVIRPLNLPLNPPMIPLWTEPNQPSLGTTSFCTLKPPFHCPPPTQIRLQTHNWWLPFHEFPGFSGCQHLCFSLCYTERRSRIGLANFILTSTQRLFTFRSSHFKGCALEWTCVRG